MKKKRVFSVLIFTLLISILAACGKDNSETNNNAPGNATNAPNGTEASAPPANTSDQYGDTGGLALPLVDKPTKLTWMIVSDNTKLNTSLIATEIKKRTGIEIDFQAYPSGTYKDKLKVILASGNLPDLFHGLPIADVNEMGSQGIVAPINEYLDQLPNFKKLYTEENPWVMNSYSDNNGNMYHWPIYGVNRDVNHGFLYRKDVFDANNIPLWTNTDEFYAAVKQLKEIYPDSFPISSKTKEYIFRDWGYGWGVTGADYPIFYDEADKTWKLSFTDPRFKDMLDFMKKLYNEGLLDPEFLTDTSASWTSKMTTADRSFVTFDWIGNLDTFANQVKADNPTYDLRYGNPVGPTNMIRSLPKVSTFGLAVTKNDKSEAALKLLDYLSSPSGAELVMLGVKGVSFEVGADGSITYPELADAAKVDIKLLEEKYGLWLEGMYLRADERSVYFDYTEREQEAQDSMQDKRTPLDPVLKFTDEENASKADYYGAIYQSGVEFATKYVLDKNAGDAQWDAWLAQAEKLGQSKYVEIFNNAQARFDAN